MDADPWSTIEAKQGKQGHVGALILALQSMALEL